MTIDSIVAPSSAARSLTESDPLEDFLRRDVTVDGITKRVYVAGSGPAVILMAEMPGINPHLTRLARWLMAAGFTVYMPSLFGRDGAVTSADEAVHIFKQTCISAEFRAMGGNQSSPVTRWLMGLARQAHQASGGPGVGAIGACFTGNFALTMMLEPAVLAPVMCQPSLPLDEAGGLEMSPEDLAAVQQRLQQERLSVLAYRFAGDRYCTAQRFAAYSAALGESFIGRVLPDDAANTRDIPPFFQQHVNFPHSALTVHLIDEAGQPTQAARDEVLAFLTARLLP
jgi:dienelactone hydrolase